MNPAEEFRRYASHCRAMARQTSERESKALWNRLADRWVHCAETAEKPAAASETAARRRRRAQSRFSRRPTAEGSDVHH